MTRKGMHAFRKPGGLGLRAYPFIFNPVVTTTDVGYPATMQAVNKIRESFISVMPIMAVVVCLHFTVAPLGENFLPFLIGGALLILGLGVFLLGAEVALVPVGEKVGAALTAKRNLPLMLASGLLIGFIVTVAEPDVQVLASQVVAVAPDINPTALILMIGAGVGIFTAVAIGRTVLRIPFKPLLAVLYAVVFICAYSTDPTFLGIAYDAGGATTGPMTVPFIMALGLGIASAYSNRDGSEDQSFGFIGLASIGPVLAVLLLGFTAEPSSVSATAETTKQTSVSIWMHFGSHLPTVAREVSTALLPLAALVALFHFVLIHLPPVQLIRTIVGLLYTFIGLILFFLGVKGGFIPAGIALGTALANLASGVFLVPVGILFGALVVCAEPAVWVLNEQVEEVSGGHIKAKVMLASLSIGVAIAVGIALLRVWLGFSIWTFIAPGYLLTFALSRFCPTLFTAIAFDSGGVASGPMASTFILSFTLGASHALRGDPVSDAFGVIAMIAMIPLITIQILGILYARKLRATADIRRPTPRSDTWPH